MHACLHVNEILRLIACEVVASGGEATAVALACCCKGFEDPVLDTLWETQYEMIPLLKTFPEDVWNNHKCTHLRRPPTTLELARFRKYARRMREFRNYGSSAGMSAEGSLVLQHFSFNEPLLPNLKTLNLFVIDGASVPFIPLFLSPAITRIYTCLKFKSIPHSKRHISLGGLPRDPMIIAAVSEMLLTTNRNTLQTFRVDCPLTEEARETVCRLSDLRNFSIVVERGKPLPSLLLPNLTNLTVGYDHDDDCLEMFRGAAFGNLETIKFTSRSEQIGDFLGTFERLALAASIKDTLSEFRLHTSRSWSPTFSSLLSFTQMRNLSVGFSCMGGCSSMVDDRIIINLARAMPELESLMLGDSPCRQIPTGVTAKGLSVLAHHCPNLSTLRIHFQVASLINPPATIGMTPNVEPTALRRDCALRDLYVGRMPMPEQSVLMAALSLVRIFPQIDYIEATHEGWEKVLGAINLSRQIVDRSGVTL